MDYNIPENLKGLTEAEVASSRKEHGYNRLETMKKKTWLSLLVDILKEPMLILLICVSVIYVFIGDYGEAAFMFVAIVAVTAISFYQDNRNKKALEELEKLNEPLSKVIRNARIVEIPTFEIVVGDLCITEEGNLINADGKIVHSNDFSVNESALTGESFSVFKGSKRGLPTIHRPLTAARSLRARRKISCSSQRTPPCLPECFQKQNWTWSMH